MLITYFDEVKYQKGVQPYYWLGGITVNADAIWALERKVSNLANECFGNKTLSRNTEFHAADIYHRKRNFKNWNVIGERISIINCLSSILNEGEDIGKIHVRIDPELMIASDFEHKAFLFFVEKVESYLRSKKSPGIIIGDRESDKISGEFAKILSQYRADGTPYSFGIELRCLIDTVHFTDSHNSRMLQLADLFVWILQLCTTGRKEKYPCCEVVNHVKTKTELLTPTRYKHWPTKMSWIQI